MPNAIDWLFGTQRRTANYADPTYIGPTISMTPGAESLDGEIDVTVNFTNVAQESVLSGLVCMIHVAEEPDDGPLIPDGGPPLIDAGGFEIASVGIDGIVIGELNDGAIIEVMHNSDESLYLCITPLSSGIRYCQELVFTGLGGGGGGGPE